MPESNAAGTVARGNITYLPVVPGRIEFSVRIRRYLLEYRPRVVAVELPSSLERQYHAAIRRLPKMSVILIADVGRDEEERATYIPVEPGDPFVEALRTAQEISAAVIFLEPASHDRPHLSGRYPEPYSIEFIGAERYLDAFRIHSEHRTPEIEGHAAAMAWKLQGADPFASTCAVVSLNMLDALLDAMEVPQDEPPRGRVRLFDAAELFNLHPDCLAEVTSEPPYYQQLYDQARGDLEGFKFDRTRWQLRLLREAEAEYSVQTGEKIQAWQRLSLAKFSRNLAVLDGCLVPAVYDLTLAARSIVDDNSRTKCGKRRTGSTCSRRKTHRSRR